MKAYNTPNGRVHKPNNPSPDVFTHEPNQQTHHHHHMYQAQQAHHQSQLQHTTYLPPHSNSFQNSAAANQDGHKPLAMLQSEDSRKSSSMSEGFMSAVNVNHSFAFEGTTGTSGLPLSPKTKGRQGPTQPFTQAANVHAIPSPPFTRQGTNRPARQYYSLMPGSDQPQLLHDYQPDDTQDNQLDPSSGKSKRMPSGVSGGKIYVCMGYGECAKTFTRSEHLARHIRKHTGERPFSCHCGRAFSRLDNLRQHVSSCHAEEFAANQRTLASLGEIHTHLSIKALRDQKRAGQVIEVDKELPVKKTGKKIKKEKKVKAATEVTDSEAGPGPSTQNHRAAQSIAPHVEQTADVPFRVEQPYAPSPIQVMAGPALETALPLADQQAVPVTRLSPGYAIRHQPFGPYGRPWTAGRPETSHMHANGQQTRPMTQNSNPDSRPSTANMHHGYVVSAAHYMSQSGVGSSENAVYIDDRPVSGREKISVAPRQYIDSMAHSSPHESVMVDMERQDLQGYRLPNSSYVYSNETGRHVLVNGQASSYRSPYEPFPMRTVAGSIYDAGQAVSLPPTPQTMQHNAQGRLVPVYTPNSLGSSNYTSSGSINSRQSRRSALSSSGQPTYMPEQGLQHFKPIGPASSSQIAEIYGNSVGAQESPFSYHPPPTASHPPPNTLGGQFEPVPQVYYQAQAEATEPGEMAYSMTTQVEPHTLASQSQDMSHYVMSARNQRRRPSLPVQSLIDANQGRGMQESSSNGHLPHEAVYYTMPYSQTPGQAQGGFPAEISPGYSFPHGVYQDVAARPHVEWENHAGEDPLVGQMDAKARALLEGSGTFGM